MARPKVTTTTRAARGRERSLGEGAAVPLFLAAALDAVARHRAASEPLERCVNDVVRARRLGPRERRALGDAVFAWARLRGAVEPLVDDALAKAGGTKPSRHDRDLCALLLARAAGGSDLDPSWTARLVPPLQELVADVAATGLPASAASALPAWLADAVRASHDDADALLRALAKPAPLVLACDDDAARCEIAAALGDKCAPSTLVPSALVVRDRAAWRKLPAALRARAWPMDDGSQAVALAAVAAASPSGADARVLDLCAGGGGKSRLLVAHGARVVAADVNDGRLREAPAAAARVVMDGRAPALAPASFDVVLVDAPCSGTGTLRRAPDLAHRLTPDDIAHFVELQRALLASAIALAKPGGVVVYATCSLLRAENDEIVDGTVASQRVVPMAIPWGARVNASGARAHLRPDRHGCDGFFVAALRVAGT